MRPQILRLRVMYTLLLIVTILFNILFNNVANVSAQTPAPTAQLSPAAHTQKQMAYETLLAKAQTAGTVRVIVGLALPLPFDPEGDLLSPQAIARQRTAIDVQQQSLQSELAGLNATPYMTFETVPFIAMKVDETALTTLNNSSQVVTLQEDALSAPTLESSMPLIGAPGMWTAGYTGVDQWVIVLDTGVDGHHPFLGDRVVFSVCRSNANGEGDGQSLCPNGEGTQVETGSSAADPNTSACLNNGEQLCNHGTHVAGIAAGAGEPFSGVAPGAGIGAAQVFTRFDDPAICDEFGRPTPCILTYDSDWGVTLEALRLWKEKNPQFPFAAINLSIGGGQYTDQTECDNENAFEKAIIDNWRSLNVAVIASAGNRGFTDALAAPACISSAIAVGATTDNDVVADFSNMHEMVDLLAPGADIESSIVGGGFGNLSGTSMATPMVVGAWALLKSINPTATVDEILDLLVTNGIPVADTRAGGTVTKPRIKLDAAGADPQIASITPSSGAGGTDLTVRITTTGTNFIAGQTTADFGTGITVNSVTVNSTTEIDVAIAIDAGTQPGVRTVSVTTGTETVAKADGFTVTGITPDPVITAIQPDHADRATSLNVTISGADTNFTTGRTGVDFGLGITVDSVTVNSPTEVVAAITIAADAEPGERTVEVTTGGEVVSQPAGFRVDIPTPPTGNSTLYFDPSPTTMNVGETRTIAVVVDPGTNEINGVQLNGELDPAHLEILSIISDTTMLSDILEPLTFDATTGSFRFSAGILGETVTEPFTLLTLDVRAVAATDAAGTPLKYLSTFPPTDISGATGSVMETALDGVVIINTVGDTATLHGRVALQGRPDAPHPAWSIPLAVELQTTPNTNPLIYRVQSDEEGLFVIEGLTPGEYSVRVKGDHTLGNQVDNVTLVAGGNEVYLGELLEGDVEINRSGNQTVLVDFGQLSGAFDRCVNEEGYVPNADLNETDDCITIEDFGLLSQNYNKQGWNSYDAALPMPLPLPFAQPNAILTFGKPEQGAPLNTPIDLPLYLDPRGGDAVTGLTVHLPYDPALVDILRVDLTDELPKVLRKPTLDPEAGSLRFSVGANLGQRVTTRIQVATIQVVLLAETTGTALTLNTDGPRDTNIAGANGSVMAADALEGVTLRFDPTGTRAYSIYLPTVLR